MTPTVSIPTVSVQTASNFIPTPTTEPQGNSFAGDVERLKALVAGTPAPAGYVEAPAPAAATTGVQPISTTDAPEASSFQTLGDSILSSISNFNNGYNHSLESINTRLEGISSRNVLDLGNNFGEVMALQIEIARWSMSVMGVDNASKAGTNTVKELSKGG